MNKIESEALKEQVYLERYKNWEANNVIGLLDKTNKEIASFIKQTSDVSSKKRYNEIARKIRDVSKALKESVGKNVDLDGLIDYELRKQKSILNSLKKELSVIKGGEINFLYPSKEQVKTAALFRPSTEFLNYQSYLDGIEEGLYNVWDNAVRSGYIAGIPTKEIVDKVIGKAGQQGKLARPGAINSLRNSVYANTRTILQSFANETRERVFEKNEKYFGDGEYKYEYLATLDSRTCLICGNLDGKLFKTLKDCPQIPQHRGCRCLVIPYFNIEGDKKASKDGYVDSKIGFNEWLDKQDEATKIDVLGKSRYEMYKKGKSINQFIDEGKILTLEQLKYADIVSVVNKIKTGCAWFNELPEKAVNDFRDDLMKVEKEQLETILEYTKKVKGVFTFAPTATDEPNAYFSPSENKIYMNVFEANKKSIALKFKTNMVTFLHECGHAIDFSLGEGKFLSEQIIDFRKKLGNDVLAYSNKLLKGYKEFSTVKELCSDSTARYLVEYSLRVTDCDIRNGISDIFAGVSYNAIKDGYFHADDYWENPKAVLREAFAHFFDARGCGGKKLTYIKDTFPTAYKDFEVNL